MCSKDWLSKVSAYVDGELPDAERADVETHVRDCLECRREAEEFRRLDEAAARARVPPVTGEEWARVWHGVVTQGVATRNAGGGRLRAAKARPLSGGAFQVLRGLCQPRRWQAGTRRFAVGLAAAAAVLAIVVLLGGPRLGPSSGDSRDMAAPADHGAGAKDDSRAVNFAAEHLYGPEEPEIRVDPDDGTPLLEYDEF